MANGNVEIAHVFDCARSEIMRLAGQSRVTAVDLGILRAMLSDGKGIAREEAEALFALERSRVHKCAEWTDFFVEAITDHVVWQARPTGVVSTPQAEWLIGEVDRAASINALAILVNVLGEAHRVPAWLPAAARGRASAGWAGVNEALAAARAEGRLAA